MIFQMIFQIGENNIYNNDGHKDNDSMTVQLILYSTVSEKKELWKCLEVFNEQ